MQQYETVEVKPIKKVEKTNVNDELNIPKFMQEERSADVDILKNNISEIVNENMSNIPVKEDMVKHPKHYIFDINGEEVQSIEIVKALLTPEEFRGYLKSSYLNYLFRADRKNGIEDLKKALTYLQWQIEFDEGKPLTIPKA